MSELLTRFFAPNGLLAQRFPQHEQRPGQLEMAMHIWDAFTGVGHTAIQAGTGLGKTFAYLVPAALYAVEMKHRIVISTGTINLQSQIIKKDVPTLQQILRDELNFAAALVKGRNNYICMRKLTAFAQATMQQPLFHDPGDASQWSEIADLFFDKRFINGDRDEIPFQVSPTLWSDLGAEADLCMKAKCPFFSECYFYQARQQQRSAQLLITNHALFFADLAIRRENMAEEEGDMVLANYDGVIFDEAQNVEDFATDHFTARVSWDRMFYLARSASSALRPDGLLQWQDEMDFMRIDGMFNVLMQKAETFFYTLAQRWQGERTVRFREPGIFEEELSDRLREIDVELANLASIAQSEEQKQVLSALSQRAAAMAEDLILVRDMPAGDDYAYWLEAGDRQLRQIRLSASPVSIADLMQETLFERVPVVLTSATLASELVKRLGMEKPTWLRLDSPFDYQRHARLYLPSDAPEATQQNEAAFLDFVAKRVPELTEISRGRAFILFTSYRSMQACYHLCADALRDQGWLVLMQGEKRRDQLLKEFIDHGHAVLFAVNSFWEGVDVQGDSLSLVVLVKLPFAVPNEPIQQARMEALQREGKDPFRSYTLPQAALKLKQGFGRLIRSRQDTGVIAIMDKRILSKYYGARFLNDLPPAPRIHQLPEVREFFDILGQAEEAKKRGEAFDWPLPETPQPVPERQRARAQAPQAPNRAARSYQPQPPSADAASIDESGFWLPEEDYSAAAPQARRRPSGRNAPPPSDDIVFDDLPPQEIERLRGRKGGASAPTADRDYPAVGPISDEIVFDDLPPEERKPKR